MSYFYELNIKCTINEKLCDFVTQSQKWQVKSAFEYIEIPNNLIQMDQTIKYFVNEFNAEPLILRMSPNTFYRFHIDTSRTCAVNMLISGSDSNCYFGQVSENEEIIKNVTELKYSPNQYYLFNTKEKHAVLNKNNFRYLLSLGIYKLDYETVYNKYKKDHCYDYGL
jgi:hypothetical protein